MNRTKSFILKQIGIITFVSLGIIIGIVSKDIIDKFNLSNVYLYWLWVPLAITVVVFNLLKRIAKVKFKRNDIVIIYLCSILVTLIVLWCEKEGVEYIQWHNGVIGGLVFVLIILQIFTSQSLDEIEKDKVKTSSLFNLFYINASKTHEIAMLLDNHIMKSVEKQQVSDEITKNSYSIKAGNSELADISNNFYVENSNKKSVFESFDVKTTKSIMLRKIYNEIETNDNNIVEEGNLCANQFVGKVEMYKDIKLVPLNMDDTILLLSILRDSASGKFKTDENIEFNLSKMVETMLEDFTVDYKFILNNTKYIIRIPYSNKSHFENDYSFSDLQLGSLDIIGINRGEIDFSKIIDTSSKFLESLGDSYNDTINMNEGKELKDSSIFNEKNNKMPFDFKPTKIEGKFILIDIVAIIQKIHFESRSSDEINNI